MQKIEKMGDNKGDRKKSEGTKPFPERERVVLTGNNG
jgi:hypothetical protein